MNDMRLYTSLSRFKYLDRNYSFKYLFIAFIGVHIPLIGIVTFIALTDFTSLTPGMVIFSTLGFTLIACGITLFMQNALARPIIETKNALVNYLSNKTLPELPTDFKDEAGLLMSNTCTALKELDNLIKEKRDFIYLLSHDLKTPLHNVLTIIHLMKDDINNDSKEEHINLIRQSTQYQLQLITSVLNLATSEFKEGNILQLINLEPLLNKVLKDHAGSLQNKQIQVLADIPENLQVKVNEELFAMALSNLVTNAIKFSTRSSEIMIRAVVMEDHVMIRVIDYGIGFNESKAPSFQPFSKSSRPGTDGESSNGLGLYFTRKIIKYHGGTLVAESEGEGKGAKFIVRLPLAA
ncbi:sensor histidine kinase [Mucilaginibacter terrae]|uniref:histidine kinase n=1 Tax=Mucilaginibacter terrae TaxID=1955052 RepID=A0ABU3GW34_9SPHI|nr:HAMP domain-containing sensor histidine kinase [Mucilaginibacter terrae]MDT3403979.1 signal transduction histidine kinase [Mucilaginibacter terrae]